MTKTSKGVFIIAVASFAVSAGLVPMTALAATKKTTRCYKGFCPASVSITKGADEKDFDNPATRCLTKDIKTMYDTAKALMEKDVAKYGLGKDDQNRLYTERIEIGWSAMHEPYCGYGSNGMKSVKHSLDKTFTRARADYLAAVKPKPLVKK